MTLSPNELRMNLDRLRGVLVHANVSEDLILEALAALDALVARVEQADKLAEAARAYRSAEEVSDRTGEWEPASEAAVVLDETLKEWDG